MCVSVSPRVPRRPRKLPRLVVGDGSRIGFPSLEGRLLVPLGAVKLKETNVTLRFDAYPSGGSFSVLRGRFCALLEGRLLSVKYITQGRRRFKCLHSVLCLTPKSILLDATFCRIYNYVYIY